jgi:hypothetical protein
MATIINFPKTQTLNTNNVPASMVRADILVLLEVLNKQEGSLDPNAFVEPLGFLVQYLGTLGGTQDAADFTRRVVRVVADMDHMARQ